MSYSDRKAETLRIIKRLQQSILNHDGFRVEGMIIKIHSLKLSKEQLFEESSQSLIARKIYRIIMDDNNASAPTEIIKKVAPLIGPGTIIWVHEVEICKIFKVTEEALKLNRDSGPLIWVDKHLGNMYHWDQSLKLFGNK
jgi:hypothetical protein